MTYLGLAFGLLSQPPPTANRSGARRRRSGLDRVRTATVAIGLRPTTNLLRARLLDPARSGRAVVVKSSAPPPFQRGMAKNRI